MFLRVLMLAAAARKGINDACNMIRAAPYDYSFQCWVAVEVSGYALGQWAGFWGAIMAAKEQNLKGGTPEDRPRADKAGE